MDLAGIKLLVEAHMMPCLGFLVKTVTMTHCCSAVAKQCLHRAKDISAPCTALPARGCGHSQHSWPKLAKGTSHSTWHCAQQQELGWGKRNGGHLEQWHLSDQETTTCEALLSWRWLNTTCLPVGSGEWIPHALLVLGFHVTQQFLLLTLSLCSHPLGYGCSRAVQDKAPWNQHSSESQPDTATRPWGSREHTAPVLHLADTWRT